MPADGAPVANYRVFFISGKYCEFQFTTMNDNFSSIDPVAFLLSLPGAEASPSGAGPAPENQGVALALWVACVGDFLWISLETENPSGSDPAPKVKGWP